MRAGQREDAWLGGSIESFCRKPFGPGWALVGDAGLTLDPITAAGITDAFRDAGLLADAVDEGLSGRGDLEAALAGFEQSRNAASLPVYHFAGQMAQLAPPPPEVQQLVRRAAAQSGGHEPLFRRVRADGAGHGVLRSREPGADRQAGGGGLSRNSRTARRSAVSNPS